MTPEERLTKAEILLRNVAQDIEKQNEGIPGLIVVSRTLLDSMQEMRQDHNQFMADMQKLRETQAATEEKLNILIDTVDRIIRRRNGKH
jgi:ABC-type transporter Mla subunit MlaD